MKRVFVTGTDTGVGKTVVAAMLTQGWAADYWKPVQAGDLDNSDSLRVAQLAAARHGKIHPESYRLSHAMSPHAAADRDGIHLRLSAIQPPVTSNHLVVEGAGGLLVPLNAQETILDLIAALGFPVVVVTTTYLGSINHGLLTLEALKTRGCSTAGIVYTQTFNPESADIIAHQSGLHRNAFVDGFPLDDSVTFARKSDALCQDVDAWLKP